VGSGAVAAAAAAAEAVALSFTDARPPGRGIRWLLVTAALFLFARADRPRPLAVRLRRVWSAAGIRAAFTADAIYQLG